VTSLYLVGGFVVVIGVMVGVVAWAARTTGEARADAEAAKGLIKRRERFDDEAGKPLASGQKLVERLRAMRERRLRDNRG